MARLRANGDAIDESRRDDDQRAENFSETHGHGRNEKLKNDRIENGQRTPPEADLTTISGTIDPRSDDE